MADVQDEELGDLIAREQRGFRGMLIAGLALLAVMTLVSAALAGFLYLGSQQLRATTAELQRQAFDMRRMIDQQNNRLAGQERRLQDVYAEIRGVGAAAAAAALAPEAMLQAAGDYLLLGRRPSIAAEAALRAASAGADPTAALYRGVTTLIAFEADGAGAIDPNTGLPAPLQEALNQFDLARSDPALAQLADAGAGWVWFDQASSERSNYAVDVCEKVLEAAARTAAQAAPAPQPLYWRAQCERKLGRTEPALIDYALALRASAAAAGDDAALLTSRMNGFHGVGTTLIAAAGLTPADKPAFDQALETARSQCPLGDNPTVRDPQMALAVACLRQAEALRTRLGQTANEISGSTENISFAHLRDGAPAEAYRNAAAVAATGLFAWNELVRALSAPAAAAAADGAERAAIQRAGAEARRNVAQFAPGAFNACELAALLDAKTFAEAEALLTAAHGPAAACARAS